MPFRKPLSNTPITDSSYWTSWFREFVDFTDGVETSTEDAQSTADSASALASTATVTIATQTASNSAAIDFTDLQTGTYKNHILIGSNIVPSTNAVDFNLLFRTGGVFQVSSYHWMLNVTDNTGATAAVAGSPDSVIKLSGTGGPVGSNTGGFNFIATLHGAASTTRKKALIFQSFLETTTSYASIRGSGVYAGSTAAVDGLRMIFSSGTIGVGTFMLCGIP
jgi:hypothetical protein